MNKDMIVRVLTWVAILIFGLAMGYVVRDAQLPSCPAEDSCVIDYRDGQWFIDGEAVTH